ncbi:MAG TPA: hypothetical protein VGR42_02240 [Casimicrobiaceae bacterium]|jgi:hypothetical protein|nr:hypothetical protein [Casimicrobiaceae bacterium]
MPNRCDTCEHDGTERASVSRLLRRGILSVVIALAAVAIVLGESWLIERGPVLFAAPAPTPRAEHVRAPAAAPAGDVFPIAILH